MKAYTREIYNSLLGGVEGDRPKKRRMPEDKLNPPECFFQHGLDVGHVCEGIRRDVTPLAHGCLHFRQHPALHLRVLGQAVEAPRHRRGGLHFTM